MYWRVLRIVSFTVAAVLGVLGAALIAVEMFDYPGGPRALLMVAAWGAPLVVLSLAALFLPRLATVLLPVALVAAAAAVVVNDYLDIVDANIWEPVGAVALFAVAIPAGLLGRRRPKAAGWNLLACAATLVLLGVVGNAIGSGSGALLDGASGAVLAVSTVLGLLYLLVGANEAVPTPDAQAPRRAA